MNAPKLTSPSVLKSILQAHGIRLSKRYGQNFLCDEHIVERIVATLDDPERVLEIGPGVGTLTLALARRAGRVVAVEIDERFLPLLKFHLTGFEHVTLIHSDILKIDFQELETVLGGPFCVVGNLPYQITSPLLDKLVHSRTLIRQAVLMVQRELAEKLLAPVGSGKGSSLGVLLQAFAHVERLFHVPKTVFFPRPDVDATVFRANFLEKPKFQAAEAAFFNVVRAAFNLRRKTIRQALIQSPFLKLPAALSFDLLKRAGIDPKRRGETLTLAEFDRVALQLKR